MKYPTSKLITALSAAAALLIVTGCTETTGGTRSSSAEASGTPSLAEQACQRDVARQTNNPDVVMLSSSYSEAGTEVIVGVGPQRARWRCIGYRDGTTGGIMSLTDEGAL